jgi:hypothetical protein
MCKSAGQNGFKTKNHLNQHLRQVHGVSQCVPAEIEFRNLEPGVGISMVLLAFLSEDWVEWNDCYITVWNNTFLH